MQVSRLCEHWLDTSQRDGQIQTPDNPTGLFPVISAPCFGHEHVPEVCRIHPASPRLMTESRLHLAGPTRCGSRISISLLPAEHVEGGFRQMPRHRTHRFVVSFAH